MNAYTIPTAPLMRSLSLTGRRTRSALRPQGLYRSASTSDLKLQSSLIRKKRLIRSASQSSLRNVVSAHAPIVQTTGFLDDLCRRGDLLRTKVLIEHAGLRPTPETLNMACYSGNLELVRYLIEEQNLIPDISSLKAAAHSGNTDLAEYLVDNFYLIPEKNVISAATDSKMYNYLVRCQIYNSFEENLLNQVQNAMSDALESAVQNYETRVNFIRLSAAIDRQDTDNVKELIEKEGVEPDYAMLYKAAYLGNDQMFDLLISHMSSSK